MQYSVLMCVYAKEQPDYLVQSISSMLNQTIPPDEFVLVCDGTLTSSLDTVIEKFTMEYPDCFHVLRLSEHKGLGIALQIGINACHNEIIARMDSDDISFENRCERQLRVFSESNVDIVGSIIHEFVNDPLHAHSKRVTPETQKQILRYAEQRNPFNHPSVMFRKEAVLAAGNYRDMPLFEDYDLWLRALRIGARCYNIQEPLVYMRVNDKLFERRGGWDYLQKLRFFEKEKRRIGFSRSIKGRILFVIRCAVSIAPISLRKAFYRRMLRCDVLNTECD